MKERKKKKESKTFIRVIYESMICFAGGCLIVLVFGATWVSHLVCSL